MKDLFALFACIFGLIGTLFGFAMNPLAIVFAGAACVFLGGMLYCWVNE